MIVASRVGVVGALLAVCVLCLELAGAMAYKRHAEARLTPMDVGKVATTLEVQRLEREIANLEHERVELERVIAQRVPIQYSVDGVEVTLWRR